ncbi:MAG: hypothetical protein HC882_06200, partial [Acidobacteria bacterium]|nr:hypothetical protein [Acidobacteriota bacterium]
MRAVVDPEPPTPGLSLRAALLVVAAALVPYLLLPPKPLILDAARSIFDNPVVLEGSLAKIFTYDYWGVPGDATYGTRSYRPLVTLTFALQARTMGTAPQVFHLADMAIHALGSILVALIAGFNTSPPAPHEDAVLEEVHRRAHEGREEDVPGLEAPHEDARGDRYEGRRDQAVDPHLREDPDELRRIEGEDEGHHAHHHDDRPARGERDPVAVGLRATGEQPIPEGPEEEVVG